jgi:ankyrin repeat protein
MEIMAMKKFMPNEKSSKAQMHLMMRELAKTHPLEQKTADLPPKEDLRAIMDKFSEYCISTLNQCDPRDENSLGLILISATYLNDIGTIQCLLKKQDQSFERFGPIAAMTAAGNGYFEIVKLLFEHQPKWFQSELFASPWLTYPFELAALNQHFDIVQFLLPTSQHLINLPARNSPLGPIPPLLVGLVKCNCLDILKLVLSCKPDLEIRSNENHTALSQACANCHYEMAEELIKAGAKVNIATAISPSQDALAQPNTLASMIHALTGHKGITTSPLEYAAANGHVKLVYLLLKSGAEVNVAPSLLGSALMLAARASDLDPDLNHFRRDYPNVVRLLLMYKAKLEVKHPLSEETALLSACLTKQVDIAKQLLLAGADRTVQSNIGEKAATLLEEMGLNPPTKISNDAKKAAIQLRAHKKLDALAKEREEQIRKDLLADLVSGKYQSSLAAKSTPILELQQSQLTKKKKKKKKAANQRGIKKDSAVTKSSLESPPQTALTAIESTKLAPLSKPTPCSAPEAKLSTPSIEAEHSAPLSKPTLFSKQNHLVSQIPQSVFAPEIPSGDTLRKFPLRLAGVRVVHYYVTLIPNELNKAFDSSHLQQLKKMWAAILSERLLPPKSKDTAGVKCLSGQEMLQLKVGLFKSATHKVKHPREDTRVYLQSKLPEDGTTNEVHLDLIGPDFHAHK